MSDLRQATLFGAPPVQRCDPYSSKAKKAARPDLAEQERLAALAATLPGTKITTGNVGPR